MMGLTGVLTASSFRLAIVFAVGLRISEGYVAEMGVCRAGPLALVFMPDAAEVAALDMSDGAVEVLAMVEGRKEREEEERSKGHEKTAWKDGGDREEMEIMELLLTLVPPGTKDREMKWARKRGQIGAGA